MDTEYETYVDVWDYFPDMLEMMADELAEHFGCKVADVNGNNFEVLADPREVKLIVRRL
jgi:hypothetical protein